MDFFEAQTRARKRTSRLLVLFGFAVAGTIAAAYFAAILARGEPSWWEPRVFASVTAGVLGIVGIASLYKWHQYSAGGRVVAEAMGGRRVNPQTGDFKERQLLNVVEEMAIASGTPVPSVYVMVDEPAINAFAAGLTTSDAVVAVTRGTLEKLTRDELQGVIGHEFSHILNGDMRLNLRIAAAVFGILVLGLAGRGVLWSLRFGRFRSRGKNSGGPILAAVAIGVALLVIGYVGYFFGRIIQAAVSRQREFLADASAVQFTRNPSGLTGALKKIGGYALGSAMNSNKSGEIGHFFFAQAFRAGFTGLWSTHPPLPERIRAIDPRFDGKYFQPPEVVDVARESFVSAGLAPQPARVQTPTPRLHAPAVTAAAAVASVGTLTPEQIADAHLLLESIPPRLREAAHTPAEAPILVYGLLLADDPAMRSRQRSLVTRHADSGAVQILDQLEPALRLVRGEHKLPLLQIAAPALREIPAASLASFLGTLDALVHADEHVSIFEFALQKVLVHTLALGREPGAAVVQYHSFNAVIDEISIVLSALAHAATSEPAFAQLAFDTGAAQLKLVESRLRFLAHSVADLGALDTALDKLAHASDVIKQRILVAAAHVVTADGQLLVTEAELLRAISASLDCPMPPLSVSSGDLARPTGATR